MLLELLVLCSWTLETVYTNTGSNLPPRTRVKHVDTSTVIGAEVSKNIYHGSDAVIGQFPFQVRLAFSTYWSDTLNSSCGGAILSESWVVTAAHCVALDQSSDEGLRTYLEPTFLIRVATGDLHVQIQEGSEQFSDVDWMYMHPEYDTNTLKNDIALLHLSEPFTLNSETAAIALSSDEVTTFHEVLVSGWGMTQHMWPSNKLKFMKQAVQSTSVCRNRYPYDVLDGMFCCGYYNMTQRSGAGDSGGPIVAFNNSTPYLVGLVSWSPAVPGKGLFDVNTDVFFYKQWIENKTADDLTLVQLVANDTVQEYTWTNNNTRFSYNHINVSCATQSCTINVKSISIHFGEDLFTTLFVSDGWETGHRNRRLKITRNSEDMASKSVGFISLENTCRVLMYTGDSSDLVTVKFKYQTYDATLPCNHTSKKCNEENDCSDLRDELGCTYPNSTTPDDTAVGCYPADFICNPLAAPSLIHCIRSYKTCDGYQDCTDGSDELLEKCTSSEMGVVSCAILLWGVLVWNSI